MELWLALLLFLAAAAVLVFGEKKRVPRMGRMACGLVALAMLLLLWYHLAGH